MRAFRGLPLLWGGILVLALCGCGEKRAPNVLLISLDACRADHLSCYGYNRGTSPFLDRLALEGTRFEFAFANTLGTTTSHATIFSSLPQESHGVELEAGEEEVPLDTIPTELPWLPEILNRQGYITVGVSGGGRMAARFGFGRGFDAFDDGGTGIETETARLFEMVRGKAVSDRPVFALLHTYQIHSPYQPPPKYRDLFGDSASDFEATSENLIAAAADLKGNLTEVELEKIRGLYDGEIRYTDDQLEAFFARLEETGFLENCLVVVTSDHGEEFGERGGLLHRGLLYDEFLRIPLILKGAGVPGGSVDDRIVSSLDIAPTILSRLNIPVPETMQGRDLFAPPGPADDSPLFAQFRRLRYSVRTREWKLIQDFAKPGVLLFHLPEDAGEKRDLSTENPAMVRRLQDALEKWRAGQAPVPAGSEVPARLSPEEIRRLKALGYVGGKESSGEEARSGSVGNAEDGNPDRKDHD